MFGLKKFAKIKKENFAKDKDRKRYFAIKEYYSKQSSGEKKPKKSK